MPTRLAAAASTLVLVLAACAGEGDTPRDPHASADSVASGGEVAIAPAAPRCAPDNGGITLPAGFCATVFADSVGSPRHMAVAPNGDLFVALQGSRQNQGGAGVIALRDADRDGRAEVRDRVASSGNTGIALFGGYLYHEVTGGAIVRLRLAPGTQRAAAGAVADTVVSGMPTGGHAARNFAIARDGALYVNIGSRTNACEPGSRQPETPGADPCTELETRAGIWRYDARKTGQRFAAADRYATGIRNAVGLAVAPDGRLWATQHGRDQLNAHWVNKVPLFTEAYSADNPAEVLLQVSRGDDFGWPYCFHSRARGTLVTAPEYGGNGTDVSRCGGKKAPVASFPGHWAPNALAFYTGTAFPAKYRNGAFIAFHGSWNRPAQDHGGYNVVFVPLRGGRAAGEFEVFADGFAGAEKNPQAARYRPTGLAQGTDGSLYISDDRAGRIWKVVRAR